MHIFFVNMYILSRLADLIFNLNSTLIHEERNEF